MIKQSPSRILPVALAVLVVAGIGVAYLTMQGDGRKDQTREVMLVVPRDGATLASLRSRFRWQKLPTATAYHFYLYEVNRTTVWSALVKDTSLVIPAAVNVPGGETYLWRVEAIMPDETTVDSEVHAFTLSQ